MLWPVLQNFPSNLIELQRNWYRYRCHCLHLWAEFLQVAPLGSWCRGLVLGHRGSFCKLKHCTVAQKGRPRLCGWSWARSPGGLNLAFSFSHSNVFTHCRSSQTLCALSSIDTQSLSHSLAKTCTLKPWTQHPPLFFSVTSSGFAFWSLSTPWLSLL